MKKTLAFLLALLFALSGALAQADAPAYTTPARVERQLSFGDISVVINADVDVPALSEFPVYALKPMEFTQQMADSILPVILDGAVLYDTCFTRTKSDVLAQIEYYTQELDASRADESLSSLIPAYEGILNSLRAELESAPEANALVPASLELKFKETAGSRGDGIVIVSEYARHGNMLEYDYAGSVTENGDTRIQWTDEARARAAQAGNAAIDGTFTQACGREMYLILENSEYGNQLLVERHMKDGRRAPATPADFGAQEAIDMATALLTRMGIDREFLSCAERRYEFDGDGAYYDVYFAPNIPGTRKLLLDSSGVISLTATAGEIFGARMYQEALCVTLDGDGLLRLTWQNPVSVERVLTQSAELLPWDTVDELIQAILPIRNIWASPEDNELAYILGRRVTINSIALSYMQLRGDNNGSDMYYVPVWDIIGDVSFKYSPAYNSAVIPGGKYALDSSNERSVYRFNERPVSLFTINAIDGSIINRTLGY